MKKVQTVLRMCDVVRKLDCIALFCLFVFQFLFVDVIFWLSSLSFIVINQR